MPRITPPPDLDPLTAHGIYRATLAIDTALDDARELNAVFMSTREKEAVLLEIPGLIARLTELNYRVMACADDVAEAHGARNVGDYIAHATNQSGCTAARDLKTARELDTRWLVLQAALREGRVNVTQSIEISKTLNELPSDLDASVLADAERVLVEYAEKLTPHDLRRAGKRIIDVVAPEISEALEGKRLADEERSARERQKLTLKPQGDGTTRISGLLTDLCANRLATALNAITNPRRDHLAPPPCGCTPDAGGSYGEACGDLECPGNDKHSGTFDDPATADTRDHGTAADAAGQPRTADGPSSGSGRDSRATNPLRKLSTPQRNARALNTLLETLDPKRLPIHGGDATTIVVTIDYETLKSGLGTATLATERDAFHDKISAGEARRLACNAGILPAILNSDSHVLDLGRTQRFFTAAQNRALAIRYPYCAAEGCRIPATWCESHHLDPWSEGGQTDLDRAVPLCSKHHHCIHDPLYLIERLAHGAIRFTRRT